MGRSAFLLVKKRLEGKAERTTAKVESLWTLSRPDLTPAGWKYLIPQLPYEPSCAGFHCPTANVTLYWRLRTSWGASPG